MWPNHCLEVIYGVYGAKVLLESTHLTAVFCQNASDLRWSRAQTINMPIWQLVLRRLQKTITLMVGSGRSVSNSRKTWAAAAWSSAAKVDQAPLTKASFLTSPIDAHEHPCQVLPFRQVYFTVRYTPPTLELAVVGGIGSGGIESPRHLPRRPIARDHATTKRSRKRHRYLALPFRTI